MAWTDPQRQNVGAHVEAPTLALAVLIYAAWLLLTLCWRALPIWVATPVGAWLCAWQMSLQHEAIHGHPTRHPRLNDLIGAPPLNLWLPYVLYRESHRRHHHDAHLTDPLEDPESTYLTAQAWRRAGPLQRWLYGACNTLVGRLLLGPARAIALFWWRQARLIGGGRFDLARIWLTHGLGVALVLGWVCGVCHIGIVSYVLGVVYPATALSMIRSLAEHRAAEDPGHRTAVVERAGPLGLLFLNNNLHLLHHERPDLPWYALPATWRAIRADRLVAHDGPVYRSYLEVAALYALRPHHSGPHPAARGPRVEAAARASSPPSSGAPHHDENFYLSKGSS
jgi:fatty acid desaturase